MRILIDCGAHSGEALKPLLKLEGVFDAIHLFECDPSMNAILQERYGKDSRFTIHPEAVWTESGTLPFYLGKPEKPLSASLLPNKRGIDLLNPILVSTIDFSVWLQEQVKLASFVCIKMDIEGAEYPVIEKMIANSTLDLVDVLYCEWHAGKRLPPAQESIARHKCLLETLSAREKPLLKRWS